MKIHYGVAPPNFDAIVQILPEANKEGIIFAYAPDVYVPKPTGKLHQSLVAHEKVHVRQQECYVKFVKNREGHDKPEAFGVTEWWARYLTDGAFRFDQELEAHRAEYNWWRKHKPGRRAQDMLQRIAGRLSSGLYGMPHKKEWCVRFIEEQGSKAFKLIEPDDTHEPCPVPFIVAEAE